MHGDAQPQLVARGGLQPHAAQRRNQRVQALAPVQRARKARRWRRGRGRLAGCGRRCRLGVLNLRKRRVSRNIHIPSCRWQLRCLAHSPVQPPCKPHAVPIAPGLAGYACKATSGVHCAPGQSCGRDVRAADCAMEQNSTWTAWEQGAPAQCARHIMCAACCWCFGGSNLRLQRLQLILLRLDGCLQLHSLCLRAFRASQGSSRPPYASEVTCHGNAGDAQCLFQVKRQLMRHACQACLYQIQHIQESDMQHSA